MKKEIYNPLFESLLNTVKTYEPSYAYKIQEEETQGFKNDEVALKYIKEIVNLFIGSIIFFAQSCPINDVQKKLVDEIITKEALKTINTDSVDNVIKGLVELIKKITDAVDAQKISKEAKIVYDEFRNASKVVLEAYEIYKTTAGPTKMSSAGVVSGLKAHMLKSAEDIKKAAEEEIKKIKL